MANKRIVKVGAIQTSYTKDMAHNIEKTIGFIRDAAKQGAQIILSLIHISSGGKR